MDMRLQPEKPRTVISVSDDDDEAKRVVIDLLEQTGFSGVELGSLATGLPCKSWAGRCRDESPGLIEADKTVTVPPRSLSGRSYTDVSSPSGDRRLPSQFHWLLYDVKKSAP